MFSVYKIYGPHSDHVYYGYCTGNGDNAVDQFLAGTRRSDSERGDVRFLNEHANDPLSLQCAIVTTEDEEWEAKHKRNELRASDRFAITGPTEWPNLAIRTSKEDKDRLDASMGKWRARQMKTARDAYAAGLWTANQIKSLASAYPKVEIVSDLDQLAPVPFMIKYGLDGAR